MRVIVAGAGAVGAQLARVLLAAGHEVALVEADPARAARCAAGGLHAVAGDAAVAGTLEAAGALRADVLFACTGSDPENLVVCAVAKRHLEIPRVLARVNDEANRWLFDGSWGVDAAVSAAAGLSGLLG